MKKATKILVVLFVPIVVFIIYFIRTWLFGTLASALNHSKGSMFIADEIAVRFGIGFSIFFYILVSVVITSFITRKLFGRSFWIRLFLLHIFLAILVTVAGVEYDSFVTNEKLAQIDLVAKSNNPELCGFWFNKDYNILNPEKISKKRKDCAVSIVENTLNLKACSLLLNSDHDFKDSFFPKNIGCYNYIAIRKKDPSVCGLAYLPEWSYPRKGDERVAWVGSGFMNECYQNYAEKYNQPEVCNMLSAERSIPLNGSKSVCYWFVAVRNNRTDLCDNVIGVENKDKCNKGIPPYSE